MRLRIAGRIGGNHLSARVPSVIQSAKIKETDFPHVITREKTTRYNDIMQLLLI